MIFEVVVCEKNSFSEGQIILRGNLYDCLKYAEDESKNSCIALMVRPSIPTYMFVNGQKQNV